MLMFDRVYYSVMHHIGLHSYANTYFIYFLSTTSIILIGVSNLELPPHILMWLREEHFTCSDIDFKESIQSPADDPYYLAQAKAQW